MGARYQILVEGKQDVVLRSTNLACMQNTREPFSRSPMPRTCVCAPCSSATAEAIVACVMCFVKRRTRAVAHERALVTAMRFAIKHPERRQHLRLELRNESREWRRGDVHSFNSFLGLPEQRTEPGTWPTWDKRLAPLRRGTFSQGGKPPFDAEGIVWHVGWFNETLPRFLAERQEPVGVLHVDCDIYSSTASVLELIEPRLLPGTVIVFDELINYPGYAAHELKAFVELLHRTGFGYRPIGASADRVVTDRAKLIAALSQPRMADVAIRQRLRGEDVAFELVTSWSAHPPWPRHSSLLGVRVAAARATVKTAVAARALVVGVQAACSSTTRQPGDSALACLPSRGVAADGCASTLTELSTSHPAGDPSRSQ